MVHGPGKAELAAASRLDLWDEAWDAWSDMPLVTAACCALEPPPTACNDGTFRWLTAAAEPCFASPETLMHGLMQILFGPPDLESKVPGITGAASAEGP